jgi:sarcosine oxidase subunit beta
VEDARAALGAGRALMIDGAHAKCKVATRRERAMEMPRTAEVVVVGAGVIGASVAYHLARAGVRDVLVIERAPGPGRGSTGKATGGFRAQFATEVNVRLSLLSRGKLRRFEEETGVDPGYRTVGYLWLARSEATLAMLREAQAVQHRCGLDEAVTVPPEEIARINPAVATDDLVGAAWCPTDGYLRPLEIVRGYVEASRRLGVRFAYGVDCCGFRPCDLGDCRRIDAVRTSAGEVACGAVVNAAGAWAAVVAREAGVDIPVAPLRRQVAITAPTDALPPDAPMTIQADDGFHLRVRDGRVLYAWPTPGDPADRWSTAVEDAWVEEAARKAARRVPALAGVPVDRAACWAGLYEASPDRLAILGMAPGVSNLCLVNGSSGHGVMHGPALGQLAAECLTHAASSMDVSALSPGRFAGGAVPPVAEFL